MSKTRRIITFIIAIAMSLGVVTDVARAQERDPNYWSANNNWYYDPTYQQTCAAGGGALRGGSTKEKIWNFLIANDLSPEQAAGIMGNMEEESRFSPTVQQDRGANLWDSEYNKAWGLVQWDGGRRYNAPNGGILGTLREEKSHLVKYLGSEYGGFDQTEPSESFPEADYNEMLLFQLDYLMQESMSRDHRPGEGFDGSSDNEWERLKEQSTARKAAIYWHWAFERSDDSPSQITERLDAAEAILEEFGKDLSAAGSGTAGCVGAEGIQELAVAYAWPEYHPADYLPTKPAYVEAVQEAQADGRYVGGGAHPGIDCGGFVTLLVTNSGYDPEYNHGGFFSEGAGNTATQLQWLRDNWRRVGRGGDINSADLRPGDVAIYNDGDNGHTFIFLGEDMVELYDFGQNAEPGIASASISSWRAPMAGRETVLDPQFEWFSKE